MNNRRADHGEGEGQGKGEGKGEVKERDRDRERAKVRERKDLGNSSGCSFYRQSAVGYVYLRTS